MSAQTMTWLQSRRRRLVCVALVASLALSLSACGDDSPSSSDAAKGGTLTIAIPSAPTSLDPARNGPGPQNIVQTLGYEPLIRVTSAGEYQPALATEWGYVGDGNKAFELKIRTDATFADGTPVTAKAVADSISYYLKTPGTLSHYLSGVSKATAEGDTVKIALDQPNPILPFVFSQLVNWGDAISPAGLADTESLGNTIHGAGPYTLDPDKTIERDTYVFNKNETYWDVDRLHYDTIIVKVLSDPNAAMQALRSGQVQVNLNAPSSVVAEAESIDAEVASGDGSVYSTFLLDRAGTSVPALGELKVRQALNYAVDRAAIAKVLGTGYEPTEQIVPAGVRGFDEALDGTYTYDVAKAKQLLAEAGYADGFKFSLVTVGLYGYDTVAQALAEQWKQIGVDVTIKSVGADFTQFITDLTTKKFAATQFYTGDEMFANALQNFASLASPLNPFASTDPTLKAALDELAASGADDQEARSVDLNRAINEQAWFVPVVRTQTYAFAHGIDNFGTVGPKGALDLLDWRPAS